MLETICQRVTKIQLTKALCLKKNLKKMLVIIKKIQIAIEEFGASQKILTIWSK